MKLPLVALAVYAACMYSLSAFGAEYKQCVVEFPEGPHVGVCKTDKGKYIKVYTCNGEMVAFVAPGALPIIYQATCGPTHLGFPGDKDGATRPDKTDPFG